MVTAAADYRINENNFITGEIAVTNNDVNTFSEIDNADNTALAYRTEYQNLHKFSEKTILSSSVNYEFTEMNFAPPERYRPVAVSYTHLRAHETVLDLVCRLLLEKKKTHMSPNYTYT